MEPVESMATLGRVGTHDEAGRSVAQEAYPSARTKRRRGSRVALTFVVVLAAVVLAGCSTGTQPSVGGMMGGNGSGPAMGGASGYPRTQQSCTAPASLPGRTVSVALTDTGMMSSPMMGASAPMGERMTLRATPASVPAGEISFVASNLGGRIHELVVLPLASGASVGKRVPGPDGRIDETGSLGEASASCTAGSGEGITPGTVGWITLTLPPGHYELVCNLQNHYANGMYQELNVT